MTDSHSFFNREEERLLEKTQDLHKALIHLRYEGKLLKELNMKSIQILTLGLDLALQRHRHIQEEILFPFLKTHIPRHEAAISLLKAEHEEIENHQEKLKQDLLNISGIPGALQETKLYEEGIYLVTLLRHHIGIEKQNMAPSLQKELREDEKEVIDKRIEAWLTARQSDPK